MRLGKLRMLALAAALVAPVISAFGDEHWPGGDGMHHGKFWRRDKVRHRLKLTDDELERLEDVLARSRQPLADMEADVKKKRAALDALLGDDRTAEATILAQVDQIEQARATLGKARVRMLLEMRSILTPEQRRQLVRLREKDKRKDGRDRAGAEEAEDK
jgi:Spy/CpxP family protein refolding chaperone